MVKCKITKENSIVIKIMIIIVLFCTYIVPTSIIDTRYSISKIIFIGVISILYFFSLKKIKVTELFFMIIIVTMVFFSKNENYLMFITLIFLNKILKYDEYIKEYLFKSNILYICLLFTIGYSVIYAGTNGRYAFTAIKEINQSGLAIFCLATMLIQKNKKVGIFTMLFGLLTISRSYYLAVFIYILSKTKTVKKILYRERLVKVCNYTNLTIISSVILILLGIFYIYQYKIGNIFWGDEVSNRLYTFLDYSNFFRFVAVINLVLLFERKPQKLLFGVTNEEFIETGRIIATELSIPHNTIVPHNLFYSHLKMYGLFSIIETVYVSNILKKVVSINNFMLYISITLYSFILGAGMYSYWLYLTVFMLIMNKDIERLGNE